MNCNECVEKISPYIDNELSEIEKKEFEDHIKECKECDKIYKETLDVVEKVKSIGNESLPDDYEYILRNKLENEKSFMARKKSYRKWISLGVAISLILIIFIMPKMFYIIKNNLSTNSGNRTEESIDTTEQNNSIGVNDSINNNIESSDTHEKEYDAKNIINNKIIKNSYIKMEIIDFNKILEEIYDYINSKEGFIENSDINIVNEGNREYREGNINIKIPQEDLDETIKFISQRGKAINISTSSDDVTKEYIDLEARLSNLNIQEKRLKELLDEAENIDDILNIENELRRIRTEIEQAQSTLENLDDLVSYSTINLEMTEVDSIDDKIQSLDNNIFLTSRKGFISTINFIIKVFQNIIIYTITFLPILILVAILIFLFRKKNNVKK
ncbi:DUF4349 domain-containing protein [Clostridium sp. D2Q-14]|uniref:DUF4349 domain-containing protein n=1 Tax=Anaeromonas gelatinilytica TaxID=2683194 RepID=UPI00193C45BC|nr:DUF4349 domain-containing protein [Anaeromonas gelatinilytica]MBS4535931.1 DUF4349 domain-containing protein [Anaeromonas gelatinilytica]